MVPATDMSHAGWANAGPRGGGTSPRAFSLIELLITTALILIMFVMLWGRSSSSRQRRDKQTCQQNLQAIHVALQIYANDHDGLFPVATNAQTSEEPLSLLVPRYTSVTAPFICPGSKDSPLPEGEPFAKRKISYAYYMGRRATDTAEVLMSDAQVNTLPKIQGQPVFSTTGQKPGNNHHKYGGNFLFCDGRAEMSSPKAPFSLVLTQGVVLLNPRP
jgi:prepilin-type N-terminal cleavage/methylation domain-containing protein/prepilin-type processing-associated H-X9-DG protein